VTPAGPNGPADGSLYIWGLNTYGQIGDGSGAAQSTPKHMTMGTKIMATVSLGSNALSTGTLRTLQKGNTGASWRRGGLPPLQSGRRSGGEALK
jgi:hypothetical protein